MSAYTPMVQVYTHPLYFYRRFNEYSWPYIVGAHTLMVLL